MTKKDSFDDFDERFEQMRSGFKEAGPGQKDKAEAKFKQKKADASTSFKTESEVLSTRHQETAAEFKAKLESKRHEFAEKRRRLTPCSAKKRLTEE